MYIASLTANAISGTSPAYIFILPIIEVLQATAGSYLLHKAHIDPLFRRYRDTFYFVGTTVGISLIEPTLPQGI
ncbi:MAG: hypothetical protein NT019_00085 [Candidatus Adlerbacteria bacterium]|nr:hypothetical protein [Candidatus Adlerbacteria bacterium]